MVVVNLGKNGCTTTTQLDTNFNEKTPLESTNGGPMSSCAGTVLDARKVATLSRHYYPEGGWGWVILGCSVMVHVLNHGLQLSFGMLVLPINLRFKSVTECTGKPKRKYDTHITITYIFYVRFSNSEIPRNVSHRLSYLSL